MTEQTQLPSGDLRSRLYRRPRSQGLTWREIATRRQMRMLSQSARLEEGTAPYLVRGVAVLSSLAVGGFLTWAGLTNINEIARTPGEIVPTGFVQTVDHLDGGTVQQISVVDGQIVQQGETLLVLKGAGAQEDLDAAKKKQWALEIRAERLRAFVNDRSPEFSRFGDEHASTIAEQAQIFKAMMLAFAQQRQVIEDQINQKQKVLAELAVRLKTVSRNRETVQGVHAGKVALHEKGLLSASRFAESEKELTILHGEVEAIQIQMTQAQSAIAEFEARAVSLKSTARDSRFHELHQVASELAQNEETIRKLEARVLRLNIQSPVRGVVKGLKVNTIGAVVAPGETLMSIVPLDEALMVEAKIPPHQIGNVKIGQPVKIKVSAYEFARFGIIGGTIDGLSATTFSDAGGSPYYRGKVKLEKSYVGTNSATNPVLPGMTVMAEIITGEKTVLDYLLKPIHSSLSTAFSER